MRKINVATKKAEMSLTVVVSAVIALVVLIVLIYIFMNSSKKTSSSFGSCGINGGVCATSGCNLGKDKAGKDIVTYQIDGATCTDTSKPVCCARADWLG